MEEWFAAKDVKIQDHLVQADGNQLLFLPVESKKVKDDVINIQTEGKKLQLKTHYLLKVFSLGDLMWQNNLKIIVK